MQSPASKAKQRSHAVGLMRNRQRWKRVPPLSLFYVFVFSGLSGGGEGRGAVLLGLWLLGVCSKAYFIFLVAERALD